MVADIMENDSFHSELEELARNLGVDLFGVADLTGVHDFVLRQGGEHIAGFPRAISIGIRLLDSIVDELYRHEEPSAIYSYRGLYNSVNASLDRATLLTAKKVQEAGFKAYPIPASQTARARQANHPNVNKFLPRIVF